MQASASDLVEILTSVERLSASRLTNDEKAMVLEDIKRCFPPPSFCINCMQTRTIVMKVIEEAIDGFTPKKAESEKPVKNRARKASAKSTKK